ALADREDADVQVHVLDTQTQCLPEAQAAAVEHAEERGHHPVALRCSRGWRDLVDRSEQPPDLIRAEDPRHESSALQSARRTGRQLDEEAVPLEEARELAKNSDARGLGLRPLVRGPRQPRLQQGPRQRGFVVAVLEEVTIEPLEQVLLGSVAIPDRALLEDEVPQPRREGGLEGRLDGLHGVTSSAAARSPSRSTFV